MGVDCSGFTQVIFKLSGIDLPVMPGSRPRKERWLKIERGTNWGPGIFDDKEEIVHVGILLDNQQIIHASGKVRIDTIEKKGLINTDTGKRIYRLKAIRRYW